MLKGHVHKFSTSRENGLCSNENKVVIFTIIGKGGSIRRRLEVLEGPEPESK